jgi:hypothetical protein
MLERVYFSNPALADLTIPNGNVHYEIGVRHAEGERLRPRPLPTGRSSFSTQRRCERCATRFRTARSMAASRGRCDQLEKILEELEHVLRDHRE